MKAATWAHPTTHSAVANAFADLADETVAAAAVAVAVAVDGRIADRSWYYLWR